MRGKKVYLAISYSRQVEPQDKPHNAVIGVDQGLKYIAVASAEQGTLFIGGGKVRARRAHYLNARRSLQSRKARKPTRSVRRAWKRLRGKEGRFGRDVDHVTSKRIVAFAKSKGCLVIAIEDLEGIREGAGKGKRHKGFQNRLHRWCFYRLASFIEYKARAEGMTVLRVEPRYTSQACPRCGHTERANRNGLAFRCVACGYSGHADLVASRNIRLRGILGRQVLAQDGPPSPGPEVPLGSPPFGTSPVSLERGSA